MKYVLCYIGAISLIGFLAMGLDKWKAKVDAYRIPEKTLFLFALLGGGYGIWAGMYTFRHKTRHWYFVYGMPFILILQIALLIFIYYGPFEIAFL